MRAHNGKQCCPKVLDALESIYREQPGLLGAVALRAVGGSRRVGTGLRPVPMKDGMVSRFSRTG